MEKLEQPAKPARGGGGTLMSEDPQGIIEEYLSLVRQRLPESIADDVISELGSYMVEMAAEMGGGRVTQESAKKTVARFGSPGEVADEYKYSMFPELLPDQLPGDAGVTTKLAEEPQLREPIKRLERTPKEPVDDAASVLVRFAGIAALIGLLVTLLTTSVGPVWFSFAAVGHLIVEVVGAILIGFFRIFYVKMKGRTLWSKRHDGMGSFQQVVTFPENLSDFKSGELAAADAIGSGFGIVIFAFPVPYSYNLFYSLMISLPTCLFLLAKIHNDVKIMLGRDPNRLVRGDYACTIASLVLMNAGMTWWLFGPYWTTGFGWTAVPVFNMIIGPLYIYQLVTRMQDLWWKSHKIESEPSGRSRLLRQLKRAELGAAWKALLLPLAFTIMPLYCGLVLLTVRPDHYVFM